MKNVIIGLYIATGALGLLLLSTSANNKEYKQVKLTQQAMYCPVVGDNIPRPSHNNTIDPETPIYTHCPSCMAGVFMASESGSRSCTFCGKPE